MIERFQGRELDEQERQVLSLVERFGWTVTNIAEEKGLPGWSFTIGLFENFAHPEVAIFGMDRPARHSILNWIGQNARDGRPFTSGCEHDWVLEGQKCWSREVGRQWYKDLFGWARWFYQGDAFPMVQCLWPATDGHYPWEFPPTLFVPQPLLYEDDLRAARMMHYADEEQLAACEWPFLEDPHQQVEMSRSVVEAGAPIVRVMHGMPEGRDRWRFLGPVDDPGETGWKTSCFHCVLDQEVSIRTLAGLMPGWEARRTGGSGNWVVSPIGDPHEESA